MKNAISLSILWIGSLWGQNTAGFTNLDTGLKQTSINRGARSNHTATFRELSQGNAVAPLAVLHGLENKSGDSMLKLLGEYGFMMGGGPREEVPSGFVIKKQDFGFLDMSLGGFSCAACHSGEFTYQGKRYRADGMPGMVDIEGWTLELVDSLELVKPRMKSDLLKAVYRMFEYAYRNRATDTPKMIALSADFEELNDQDFQDIKESWAELQLTQEMFDKNKNLGEPAKAPFSFKALSKDPAKREYQLALISAIYESEDELGYSREEIGQQKQFSKGLFDNPFRFSQIRSRANKVRDFGIKMKREVEILQERYHNAVNLVGALRKSPRAGFGRDDAWGLIDLIIGGSHTGKLDSAISIPPLFGCGDYQLFHCDGNTNSMMDRNIAQAVTLGAKIDVDVAGIDLRAVYQANQYAEKIKGPLWPTSFPKLDETKMKRGRELFHEKVYSNYESWNIAGENLKPKGSQASEMVSCADCHQNPKSYREQIFYDIGTSKKRLMHYPDRPGMMRKMVGRLNEIRKATVEHHKIPVEETRKWEKYPDEEPYWNEHKGYLARPLDGIWASAPYLHNGSVRTLHDLLLPANKRPARLWIGNREFDPDVVGFKKKKVKMSFLLNTKLPGNSKEGHEFGTRLSPYDRSSLIEYMKTFSMGTRYGE